MITDMSDSPLQRRAITEAQRRVLVAVALMVVASLFFASCDIAAKLMRQTAPASLVTWLRYVVYVAVAVPYVLARRGPTVFRPRHPWLCGLRGACAVSSTTLFITGLAFLDVPTNTALHFMSPIYMTVLAVVVLRERVAVRQWLAALIGFCGVLIIVRPGTDAMSAAVLFPIGSGVAWAVGALLVRLMPDESAETIFLWTGIVGAAIASLTVVPDFRLPGGIEWLYALGGSLAFAVAHIMMVTAMQMAPLSLLAPISYVQIVFTGILSVAVVGAAPDLATIAGSVLVAVGGLESARQGRSRRGSAAETPTLPG
jgi:drug/metabolite transporter (DMT)-like permease